MMIEKSSTSVLEVLIFIPVMSLVTAKPFNVYWRPNSEEANKFKSSNLASSDSDTFIGSDEFIQPVHVKYETEG